ncbi:tape measure protein, partial [Erythrobacter sp. NE805]|uniref:tape measure protein n=1 Tax=Erythrobacter sp. NE805 TaxID=3389875 RepID=UPI00396B2821
AGDLRSGERSLADVARSGRRFAALGLRQAFDRAGAGARRLGRDLLALERRLKLAERAGYATGRGLKKLGVGAFGLLKNGVLAGGAAAVGAGSFALFDLFRTAGQFEQYQAMLEGTEGSVAAARKSMAWVTQFAEKTPYELDQVMEAFVALKAYGIDPMDGTLRALGDAASGMSKPLDSAVQAIADAMTDQYERLKEFSIRAEKAGNRTTFSYVKNGKTITRVAKGEGEAVREALVGIFNERFGGGMERQATTLFGIIANLKDMWSKFLLMVAKAGIFDFVKGKLQGLLDRVNEMAANGELQKWAGDISDKLVAAFKWGEKFIKETDWDAVGRGLASGVEALTKFVELLGKAVSLASRVKGWLDETDKAGDDAISRMPERWRAPAPGFKPRSGTGPKAPPLMPQQLNQRFWPKQSRVDVGGKLEIGITAPPGYSARATAIAPASTAMPIEVRTGRTMRSAA